MIVAYRAANLVDAQLVADELRAHGVGCEVTGGYLSGAIGELPPSDVIAVRLHDRHDEARARDVVESLEAARRHPRPDWTCEGCEERLGGEFGACWSCGRAAPPVPDEAPRAPARETKPF